MLKLELADGCIQGVAEEAVQGSDVVAAGGQDRLQHSDIRAGHGLVDHAGRPGPGETEGRFFCLIEDSKKRNQRPAGDFSLLRAGYIGFIMFSCLFSYFLLYIN